MNKKLSIIIPVFNEEKTVKAVIEKVLAQKINNWQKEVIVVDDGSTDNTQKELKIFSDEIIIVRHNINLGKGSALKTGFLKCSGDAVIIQDADLEYSPSDWPAMIAELEKNPDVVKFKINPLYHYIAYGFKEGRDPHPLFNVSYYMDNNREFIKKCCRSYRIKKRNCEYFLKFRK